MKITAAFEGHITNYRRIILVMCLYCRIKHFVNFLMMCHWKEKWWNSYLVVGREPQLLSIFFDDRHRSL